MRDDAARGSQELTQAARRASDNERLSLLIANEAIAMNAFSIAARVVFNTIKHGKCIDLNLREIFCHTLVSNRSPHSSQH